MSLSPRRFCSTSFYFQFFRFSLLQRSVQNPQKHNCDEELRVRNGYSSTPLTPFKPHPEGLVGVNPASLFFQVSEVEEIVRCRNTLGCQRLSRDGRKALAIDTARNVGIPCGEPRGVNAEEEPENTEVLNEVHIIKLRVRVHVRVESEQIELQGISERATIIRHVGVSETFCDSRKVLESPPVDKVLHLVEG